MSLNVRLICVPSGDGAFAGHARQLLAELPENGDMEQSRATFERLLRERYPDAIVRSQHQLAAVGPAAETVWYATNRHYRSRLSATVEVGAEQPLVFDIYTRRFPDWQVAVSVRRAGDGDGLVGTTYVATYRVLGRQFKGRFTIIDADPPNSVRLEAEGAGGIKVWYVTSFRPTSTGTVVEVVGDYDLPSHLLSGLTSLGLERAISRDIDRAHEALRELCERLAAQATEGGSVG